MRSAKCPKCAHEFYVITAETAKPNKVLPEHNPSFKPRSVLGPARQALARGSDK